MTVAELIDKLVDLNQDALVTIDTSTSVPSTRAGTDGILAGIGKIREGYVHKCEITHAVDILIINP